MTEFNGIKVKFKNLTIGYYFLYDNKAYLKINDYSAIVLFSYLEAPIFTNASSHYFSIDKNLNYNAPSFINRQFEPDEIVDFVKKSELKIYIHNFYQNNRGRIKFSEIGTNEFFFDPISKLFYKKISFFNAVPIYKNKYGLDGNENINITSISSANVTESKYNRLLYNGSELIRYDLNSWNVTWFETDFKSFNYKSFDTERNWDNASSELLDFIKNIPDNKLVFITNSNNSNRNSNLSKSDEVLNFNRIYKEFPEADAIFTSVGITPSIINNISHGATILVVAEKNNKILSYNKIEANSKNMKYDTVYDLNKYVTEYTYSFNISSKTINSGSYTPFKLEHQVIPSTQKEVTCRLLYDLPETDFRISNSEDINIFNL